MPPSKIKNTLKKNIFIIVNTKKLYIYLQNNIKQPNTMKKFLYILPLLIVGFISCQSEISNIDETDIFPMDVENLCGVWGRFTTIGI